MDIYNNFIILIPCILFTEKEKEKKKDLKNSDNDKKKLKPEKIIDKAKKVLHIRRSQLW